MSLAQDRRSIATWSSAQVIASEEHWTSWVVVVHAFKPITWEKQGDLCKFKARLFYRASFRTGKAGHRRLHRETLSEEIKQTSNKVTTKKNSRNPWLLFSCALHCSVVRFTHPSAGSFHSSTCVPTSTEILPVIPKGPSLWLASPLKTLFMPGSSYLPALLHSCLLPLSPINPDCFSY